MYTACLVQEWFEDFNNMMKKQNWKILHSEYSHCAAEVMSNVNGDIPPTNI
jgi:hypothetical protein